MLICLTLLFLLIAELTHFPQALLAAALMAQKHVNPQSQSAQIINFLHNDCSLCAFNPIGQLN